MFFSVRLGGWSMQPAGSSMAAGSMAAGKVFLPCTSSGGLGKGLLQKMPAGREFDWGGMKGGPFPP